ncbi:zinc finger C2HC domain-containing protein 1A isoform X1 [Acipenser oxyrinchus oxyrinchus]|uniref:Zinc finger C2HC domain-containing protein 1A n=1 Tax=Acipenser oxyrinchus oxyrinchus TaxID=40147 RepID=A0AAD8LRA7_ACIOX|nr:zinc finger C2HC domain-containing protein 1A isoform X1 [Acipenser oxyrinchus oxyrinchus]
MEEYEAFETSSDVDLIPCKICGRTFFLEALKKHVPICQKAAAKKRKVFDSSRQRAEGTDIPVIKPLKPKLPNSRSAKSDKPEPPKKQSNWRRKHEDFIATIRAAKGLTHVMKEGGPLPPPPPPSYDPDYIQCPFCQRRFSENAADRHIQFCKEKAARIPNKGKISADTKGKPSARPQLKPPAPKKTNAPASLISPSSRLPQPSSAGKPAGGLSSNRNTTPVAGSIKSNASNFSPSRMSSAGSQQTGISMKSRAPTSPASLKNVTSGVPGNRRKTYNADSYSSRNDAKSGCDVSDYSAAMSYGENKSNGRNSSGQLSKFCHECGTKYPVEWAKFCCECGVKRMCI